MKGAGSYLLEFTVSHRSRISRYEQYKWTKDRRADKWKIDPSGPEGKIGFATSWGVDANQHRDCSA